MKSLKIKISEPMFKKLSEQLFSRYPQSEWATFLKCGWSEGEEALVISVRDLILPCDGDLDATVDSISIDETYTLRSVLGIENEKWALGLVHSHPEGCFASPSLIDDKMDGYYAEYLRGFTPNRPYVSFIVSRDENDNFKFSGRAFFKNQWLTAESLQIVGKRVLSVAGENFKPRQLPIANQIRIERLSDIMGQLTSRRLWNSTVVVIGCGGTGSAVIHSLARSCIGRLIIIDPDRLSPSNFERVHGCRDSDLELEKLPLKIEIMKRMVAEINPSIQVTAFALPAHDPRVLSAIADGDLVLGCTDSNAGRVFVSDLALRFLMPVFNVNVCLDGRDGIVSDQIIQFTHFGPGLPCAYCRGQVNARELAQELMSDDERAARKAQAQKEVARASMYWVDEPIIPTTGSLATAASEIIAAYAIGLLTETSSPPMEFFELNLLRANLGVVSEPMLPRKNCLCADREGGMSQDEAWLGISQANLG